MRTALLLVLHAGKCGLMLQSPRGLASKPGKEASAMEPQEDDSGGRLFSLGSKFGLPFSLGDALAEEAKALVKGSKIGLPFSLGNALAEEAKALAKGSKIGLPFSLRNALAEETKALAMGSSTVGGAWRRLQPLD
jgi:hypothetical protein